MSEIVESVARRDRDARREAILDAAAEVFLEEGFAAASMSAIATRVGGSKGTLYNYFKSKEALFEAYIRRHCAWQQEAMFALLAPDSSIGEALTQFGRSFLASVLSEFSLRNYRLVVAEALRAPEIGQAFYQAGPLSGVARLAAHLERAARDGQLQLDDPMSAAHQFIGLCQNRLMKARLCNAISELTSTEIDAEVAAAVTTFLRAFGPGAESSGKHA
jgi:AcrR family transcriptional regulator